MVHEKVEEIRKRNGVTKAFLANKLGISLMTYIHISKGRVRLDVERLIIIADALNVDPSVFFENKLTESVDGGCGVEKATI